MAKANKFDSISVAYRSRLLYRSEARFREALGVSFETIANNKGSARDMEMYYGIIAHEADKVVDEPLEDIVKAYTEASEFYLLLDWGDRSQLASRRKFCRMLFRLYATAGKKLSNDEIFKFKIKNDDERLLKAFFPDGSGEAPVVDIRLITLFAFGVLRPFTENSRGRDIHDKDTIESLKKLRALVELLRDDIPRLGSTEKPIVFDECLGIVDNYLADSDSLDDCTPIFIWSLLIGITKVCRSLMNAERLRVDGERLCGLYMYGIWIDDADRGRNRFWIFPDNCLLAFCYEYDGVTWNLSPYEFKVRFAENPDYVDSFIMVTPDGNLNFILSSDRVIESDKMSTGSIEAECDDTSGEIVRVTFNSDTRPFPDWFEWRSWQRLDPGDERYERFHALLGDIYNPNNPSSMFFKNNAPELTDLYNNWAGRDNKYIYVYDWQPKRVVIREREKDTFMHEVAPGEEIPGEALFELKISAQNPLYAIPLDVERKNYGSLEIDRFVEMLSDADNIRDVYVVHSARTNSPRLAFPEYSVTIGLDIEVMDRMGILKFTESPFRWQHNEVIHSY